MTELIPLTPEIRERRKAYVAALKSDKYRQVHGTVEFAGAYCAIGVGIVVGHLDMVSETYGDFREYYGLNHNEVSMIWRMNDHEFMTLPEIGECLEKEWKW